MEPPEDLSAAALFDTLPVWHLPHGTQVAFGPVNASTPVSGSPSGTTPGRLPSAAPSTTARFLALLAIMVAGACGGLVGHAVTDLQCTDSCPVLAGSMGLIGAVLAAVGVGIVAVLALRAMAEWQTNELQQAARDHHPVD